MLSGSHFDIIINPFFCSILNTWVNNSPLNFILGQVYETSLVLGTQSTGSTYILVKFLKMKLDFVKGSLG